MKRAVMIDVHTHLWPASETSRELLNYFEKRKMADRLSHFFSSDGLLEMMEDKNIAKSIVSAIPLHSGMSNEDLSPFNDHVRKEIGKAQDRLIGFCTVDPLGGRESVSILKKYIEEGGFRGLKLHPCIQEFYPNDERVYALYETMQQYGLPVLFHTGGLGIPFFRDSFGQPSLLDDVACRYPELPILMGHAGRIWYDETAMLLRKHSCVYADISTNMGRSKENASGPMEWLLTRVKVWAGSFDRMLFGSDYPFYFPDETLDALKGAQKALNRHSRDFMTDSDIVSITDTNPSQFIERRLSWQNATQRRKS
jgi:predicted TIM-barrel fold metal-dependent hydrolase